MTLTFEMLIWRKECWILLIAKPIFCSVILHKVSITQFHGLCKVCSISFELKWLKSTQLLLINFLLGIY